MFGVSFTELLLIASAALIFVGPDRLPKMLGTLGKWSAKLRRLSTDMRQQSGIDDMLRKEGIAGGLSELRQLRDVARGNWAGLAGAAMKGGTKAKSGAATERAENLKKAATVSQPQPPSDPFAEVPDDRSREYPTEGCDAYGCLPDDLVPRERSVEPSAEEALSATDGVKAPSGVATHAPESREQTASAPPQPGPPKPDDVKVEQANAPPAPLGGGD